MSSKLRRKPPVRNKIIKTELGPEKRCTKCDELYPLASEFFYRDGKDKAGRAKFTAQCKDCYKESYRTKPTLRSTTEVTGDEYAIKREFERIERACQHKQGWELKHKADAQTKTPSADTDGV